MKKRSRLLCLSTLLASTIAMPALADYESEWAYPIYSGYGNISTDGYFTNSQRTQVTTALGGLQSNNFGFFLPNLTAFIDPYSETTANVNYILIGDETPGVIAYTYSLKDVRVNTVFFTLSKPVQMVTILHEADHRRYGAHTCGTSQDADDNGPYGVESYYAIKLYWNSTNLESWQKQSAGVWAMSRATYNMCGNQAAYNRINNAYINNVFPQWTFDEHDYY